MQLHGSNREIKGENSLHSVRQEHKPYTRKMTHLSPLKITIKSQITQNKSSSEEGDELGARHALEAALDRQPAASSRKTGDY